MMSEDHDKRGLSMSVLRSMVIRDRTQFAWMMSRGGSRESAWQELKDAQHHSSNIVERLQHYCTDDPNSVLVASEVARSPLTGMCDAFAGLRVFLHGVSEMSVREFCLLATSSNTQMNDDGHVSRPSSSSTSESTSVSSPQNSNAVTLDLPLLVVEHKKEGDESQTIKATNQMRMYLTASVKFLQAVGITGFVVYGMVTAGSRVSFPAAVLTDEGVHDFIIVSQANG